MGRAGPTCWGIGSGFAPWAWADRSCNLNVEPCFKEAISACLRFEESKRPSVSALLGFRFRALAAGARRGCMHYKRTSASQTPNSRVLLKPFDFGKYLNKAEHPKPQLIPEKKGGVPANVFSTNGSKAAKKENAGDSAAPEKKAKTESVAGERE